MNNINNKIGEKRKMNCGEYATIINVKNGKIDVQFENGNIIYDKYYGNFKKGQIKNYINHINETRLMNCGLNATIIYYKNYHDIDILFEDGKIIKNKGYDSFLKGSIAHESIKAKPHLKIIDKKIGEIKLMNCGMECKIIDYKNCNNITVEFEDGTVIKNKKYHQFKNGLIKNKNIKKDYSYKIGEIKYNKDNIQMKIIEFFNPNNITVELENKKIFYNRTYDSFKNGTIGRIKHIKNKKDKIGETNINKYGEKFEIIKYNNYQDITIKFENGYEMKTFNDSFICGRCFSPYAETVYNIGFKGEGDYSYTKNEKMYNTWCGIFTRCYNEKYLNKKPTYKDCTVCDEWHNFQNFAKWYEENYYELGNELMCLDKDFLLKNNKIYCPTNCIFVPNDINVLLTNCKTVRGKYPIGVSYKKKGLKHYSARVNNNILNSKTREIGNYNTPEEAFYAYKEKKEQIIKQIADEYKQKYENFPQKLYDAMYNYEVEITD